MIRLPDRCPNTTKNRLSLAKWAVAATGQSKALCKAPVTSGPWITDTEEGPRELDLSAYEATEQK